MFDISTINDQSKESMYSDLKEFTKGLFYEERDVVANMSNLASLLYNILEKVNWAGFYLFKEGMLVLGPFNGKPACIRIPLGKGVCGTAATEKKTQLVKNVHQYPGHIACDGSTNSEIVIPMVKDGQLLGVLDIDSPILGRFDEEDQRYLEEIVEIIVDSSDW